MRKRSIDYRSLGDAELVARCRGGDAAAWHALVDRHERLVLGIARAFGLQYADADDVFQRVFTDLFEALGRLRDPEKVGAWLATAARRASLRLRRGERRRAEAQARATSEESAKFILESAEAELVALEERARMSRAIDELGEPCRTLLLGLFANPPRSYRQLSKQLGLAIGSLGSARSRCLQRLRRILARHSLRESFGGSLRATPVRGGDSP